MREELHPAAIDVSTGALNRSDLVREAQAREAEAKAARRDWQPSFRARVLLGLVVLALWGVAIQARLVHLQVISHDDLLQRAGRQWTNVMNVPPKRGDLVDRKGRVLAYSVEGHAVFADPRQVADREEAARLVCAAIDGCTSADRAGMVERMGRRGGFQYLWRRASPKDAAAVGALRLAGIGIVGEQRRYYPNRELAAHVIGFTNIDNQGLGGIESAYNRAITGEPGRILLRTDAKEQAFGRIERPPTAGATLELTIDRDLQYIAERELAAGVREYGAVGGTVIVLEPRTGDVLALANWPTFNPNRFQDTDARHKRNRAAQEIYEPGSTFKIVTASAALEENLIRPNDPIDVSAGNIRFGARQIDDVHRYGTLTFSDVIVKSSNVGAIRVGLRIGAPRLIDYVNRFGFGEANARDLPGQSRGIVWKADRLTDSALASVSMGYQVGVTPIQMAAAVNAIATGGSLLEPRLVRAEIRGNRRIERPSRVVRQAISAGTAAQLTAIMEAVVEHGTAKAARLEGYTIAGKTGTAAKLENGRYSKSNYNASFIGFVPSRRPAITVLVVLDSPHGKGYYGGAVAAPVFKRIAEAMLRHLGVPPNVDPSGTILLARREDPGSSAVTPAAAHPSPAAPRPRPVLTAGLMPDLRGLNARDAARLLAQIGVAARLLGDGLVLDQEIPPGTPIDRGLSCVLRLGRRLTPVPETRVNP
jgi:cell division protein FtsI (penicillin-binding protein 3)